VPGCWLSCLVLVSKACDLLLFSLVHIHWQYCLIVLLALESHVFKESLFALMNNHQTLSLFLSSVVCSRRLRTLPLSLPSLDSFLLASTVCVGPPVQGPAFLSCRSHRTCPSTILELTSFLLQASYLRPVRIHSRIPLSATIRKKYIKIIGPNLSA
jgi:hypothetical protein